MFDTHTNTHTHTHTHTHTAQRSISALLSTAIPRAVEKGYLALVDDGLVSPETELGEREGEAKMSKAELSNSSSTQNGKSVIRGSARRFTQHTRTHARSLSLSHTHTHTYTHIHTHTHTHSQTNTAGRWCLRVCAQDIFDCMHNACTHEHVYTCISTHTCVDRGFLCRQNTALLTK
jgi:hypothetical protein